MSRPRVAAAVEAWSAALGWWDHRVAGRDHTVWTVIDGTKALSTSPAGARIAAVLVSYNDRELTLDCIDALRRSTHPLERIVVVDNAGSDGTAAAVASAHPDVHVLRLAGNDGLAHGFNEGVRQALAAGCDYILQVNPDVVIASNFLERALEAAAREPRAASIGGPVFYADDPERLWYAGGEIAWWLGKTYHRGRKVVWGPAFAAPRRVAYANGAAVLLRAEALRDVGAWDEEYFLVFEETDWCVRATRRGWRHLYVPDARAWHRVSTSFGGEKAPLYLYFLFRNNIRFMRRLGRPWHWPSFLLFFVAESLCRYSLTALVAPDRGQRLRAIWLAAFDAARGRYGRGSLERIPAARSATRTAGAG